MGFVGGSGFFTITLIKRTVQRLVFVSFSGSCSLNLPGISGFPGFFQVEEVPSLFVFFSPVSSLLLGLVLPSSDCVGSKELALNPAFPLSPVPFNFYEGFCFSGFPLFPSPNSVPSENSFEDFSPPKSSCSTHSWLVWLGFHKGFPLNSLSFVLVVSGTKDWVARDYVRMCCPFSSIRQALIGNSEWLGSLGKFFTNRSLRLEEVKASFSGMGFFPPFGSKRGGGEE